MFYTGQKVVCVDDSMKTHETVSLKPHQTSGLDGLTKGRVYTVRKVQHVQRIFCRPADEVLLDEIVRAPHIDYLSEPLIKEVGYLTCRFRPLQTKETDISVFKRMLTDADLHERV